MKRLGISILCGAAFAAISIVPAVASPPSITGTWKVEQTGNNGTSTSTITLTLGAGLELTPVNLPQREVRVYSDIRGTGSIFIETGARLVLTGGAVVDLSGTEPIAERQLIPGVTEIVDPEMDPRPRAPSAIVLATELSSVEAMLPPVSSQPFGQMQYRDARSHALLRELYDGTLGYVRAFRATCELPWPLACRAIHHSTAGEVWIYVPSR